MRVTKEHRSYSSLLQRTREKVIALRFSFFLDFYYENDKRSCWFYGYEAIITMRDSFSFHSLRQHQPKSLLWAALSLIVLFYFCYHYVSGNRGLFAYNKLKSESAILDDRLMSLQQQNNALHRRVTLLRKDNIDQDMLDEQARTILGYGEGDEKVIPLPLDVAPNFKNTYTDTEPLR